MIRQQATSVTLNGQDLGLLFGFALDPSSASPFDAPDQDVPGLAIPSAAGIILPGTPPVIGPRTLAFSGAFVADAQSDVVATEAAVKEIAGSGLVEIIFAQQPARAWYGVLRSLGVSYPSYRSSNRVARATFAFLCPFPYAVALTPDVVSFGATATAIPLGNAPSRGRDEWSAIIEIVGAATTPTLSYLNASGDVLGTMVFTNSPAAGDSLSIDLGRRQVWTVTSGVWANGFGNLTAGYSWPSLDPADGDVASGQYPQLKVSSGVANLRYRKFYR